MEPFFDQYYATTIFQGAKNVFVPLHPPKEDGGVWTLDLKELEAAITPKTRALVVNTPHNPTGKVFTRKELEGIAEVSSHHIGLFKSLPFRSAFAETSCVSPTSRTTAWCTTTGNTSGSLPCPACGSALSPLGRAGSLSPAPAGVSVSPTLFPENRAHPAGWLFGEVEVIAACVRAHSRLVFCTNSPFQETLAIGLEQAPERHFFEDQLAAYQERRDVICSYFDQLGLPYTAVEGTYFLLVDMSKVKIPDDYVVPEHVIKGRNIDYAKCWWMAQTIKVVSIPPSEVSIIDQRGCIS